ncbi:MAG: hypothetical protein RL244_1861 [Pseudomonadota bacterium]|jgi:hypothetical protein
MRVFLDTEFTNVNRPELISLGLVAEDGREFDAERTDFSRQACSGFVDAHVLSLLGRVPGAACDARTLADARSLRAGMLAWETAGRKSH